MEERDSQGRRSRRCVVEQEWIMELGPFSSLTHIVNLYEDYILRSCS